MWRELAWTVNRGKPHAAMLQEGAVFAELGPHLEASGRSAPVLVEDAV